MLQIGDGDRDASFDRDVGLADQFLSSIDADIVSVTLWLKIHVSIFVANVMDFASTFTVRNTSHMSDGTMIVKSTLG